MDQHLDFITLGVSDLAASRRFYVEGLGWEPYFEMPGDVIFFRLNHGLTLSLFGRSELLAEGGGGGAPAGPPAFSMSHNVDSEAAVVAAYERALAGGATPLAPPTRAEWGGFTAYVGDPDGFRWEIAHNPGWWVDDAGDIHLASTDG